MDLSQTNLNEGAAVSITSDVDEPPDEDSVFKAEDADFCSLETLLKIVSLKRADPFRKDIHDYMKRKLKAIKRSKYMLKDAGFGRAGNSLQSRLSQPYGSWQKDQYVSATNLKDTFLSIGELKPGQYEILLALVVHDLYSFAKNLALKWNKEIRH
jgi:hypothetical protein